MLKVKGERLCKVRSVFILGPKRLDEDVRMNDGEGPDAGASGSHSRLYEVYCIFFCGHLLMLYLFNDTVS